jgi:hypothetical protein
MTSGVILQSFRSFQPQHAPSATVSNAIDAKSKVEDSESEYVFVWRLNQALLDKADGTCSIKFVMPYLHDLKVWFNSIGKQQSYIFI